MQIVKTKNGKSFEIELKAGHARRWKAAGLVDLLDPNDFEQVVEFEMSPTKRMQAYFELCIGQHGIEANDDANADAFFEDLNADDMEAFDNALTAEIDNFTQRSNLQIPLEAMREKATRVRSMMIQKTAAVMTQIDPAMEAAVDRQIAEMAANLEKTLGEITTD